MMKRRTLLAATPSALIVLAAARVLAQANPASVGGGRSMRYRQLGSSDLTVSVVGLGCNKFGAISGGGGRLRYLDLSETQAVVDAAFDAGVTFFDTADSYGQNARSEAFLGKVLKDRRHNVVVATKWGAAVRHRTDVAWGSRDYIRQAVEDSLRRLQTDYIDLYQLHFPDPKTPISETLAALDALVKEGKVRYIAHRTSARSKSPMRTRQHATEDTRVSSQYKISTACWKPKLKPKCFLPVRSLDLDLYPISPSPAAFSPASIGATNPGRRDHGSPVARSLTRPMTVWRR